MREIDGPAGAPTLLLVHGWLASGGLNWFRAFADLSGHFRVIAPDLRGHGRGIRSRRRFRLTDCADDLAALCGEVGAGPVIAVGYSMGGPVTQLLWRRHPHLVEGLVQCATFDRVAFGSRSRIVFGTMMVAAVGTSQVAGGVARVPVVGAQLLGPKRPYRPAPNLQRWATAEMRRHDWTTIAEAGVALSRFSSRRWVGEIDVPTAVIVTTADGAVHPDRQRGLAARIPGASIHEVPLGHTACASALFTPSLVAASLEVAQRVGHRVPSILRVS